MSAFKMLFGYAFIAMPLLFIAINIILSKLQHRELPYTDVFGQVSIYYILCSIILFLFYDKVTDKLIK